MGRIRRAFDEAAMRSQRGHLSLLPLATLVSPLLSQLKFNGGVSSSSNSNDNQNQGFNNQNQGFNNQNQGFNNQNQNTGRCQCNYSLTFSDQNGNTHGACQRRDNTGRTWCYTTGWNNNCGDLQSSKRHPNNPWSYAACNNQG